MDPSIIVAVLALVSSLGGVFVANRYTARTAREAAATTREIEDKKLDISSWQDQVRSWREDVAHLREMRASDQERHDREINEFEARIGELERQRRGDARVLTRTRLRVDALLEWSRIAVSLLTQAQVSFPPLPAGVEETSPGGLPPTSPPLPDPEPDD